MSDLRTRYRHHGADHTVSVETRDDVVHAQVDGEALEAREEWVSPGILHLRIGERSLFAHISARGDDRYVTYKGVTYVLTVEDDRRARRTARSEHPGGLSSPMPGKVIKVNVQVGDAVEKGQTLLVLEAMKMEHAIRAPVSGVVKHLTCAEGETVEGGVELIDVEPAEDEG